MAKTVGGIPTDSEGNIVGKPTSRKVSRIREVEFKKVPVPKTRLQKIVRAAIH